MNKKRRAVTLVLVLVCLTVGAAVLLPLGMLAATSAVIARRQSGDLGHRLAAESVLVVLPDLLERDRGIRRSLDAGNAARLHMELDTLHVDVLIQDDSAKLPFRLIAELQRMGVFPLEGLAGKAGLAPLKVPPTSSATTRVDAVFERITDRHLFGRPGDEAAWYRWVSPLGERVNVRRASDITLDALLADVQPGLGMQLARALRAAPDGALAEWLQSLPTEVAADRRIRERLTDRTERISLLIRTSRGDDVRQFYWIVSASDAPEILIDWTVAP